MLLLFMNKGKGQGPKKRKESTPSRTVWQGWLLQVSDDFFRGAGLVTPGWQLGRAAAQTLQRSLCSASQGIM